MNQNDSKCLRCLYLRSLLQFVQMLETKTTVIYVCVCTSNCEFTVYFVCIDHCIFLKEPQGRTFNLRMEATLTCDLGACTMMVAEQTQVYRISFELTKPNQSNLALLVP